jgi:DNA repair protein RecN (Recombination protein N)
MLRRLRIENFALIESLALDFAPGFTALTGETGAGKSVLLDSLQFLLGARASAEQLRTGSRRALVEAELDVPEGPATAWLRERGLDDADQPGTILLRRELGDNGRSRAAINGRMAPVGDLAGLGRHLVEFHAQGAQFELLEQAAFEDFYDAFADALRERDAMAAAHHRLGALRDERAAWEARAREAEQRLDFLEFQIGELEALGLREGEFAELEAERGRLAHVAELMRAAAEVTALLQGEDGPGAAGLLGSAQGRIEEMAVHDPTLEALAARAAEAAAQAEELARDIERYAQRLEADPARLEEVDDRIAALRRALRKHGPTEADALARLAAMQAERDQLRAREEQMGDLAARIGEAERTLAAAATALRRRREAAASVLPPRVASLLRELALPKASVQVAFENRPSPTARGSEAVELLFSANVGEAPRPLRKVASGGELSRVMLALRAIAADRSGAPVLVLDEVDAGLSGTAAARVGSVLAGLAASRQVLCVTHSASVAAAAGAHFHVSKGEDQGRTRTQVRALDPGERRAELARILDGRGPTPTSLALADELLRATAATASGCSAQMPAVSREAADHTRGERHGAPAGDPLHCHDH